MTDLDAPTGADRSLEPDDVSSRSFPTAFRGFDPVQVRAFLGDVADELRRLRDAEAELRRRLEAGEGAEGGGGPAGRAGGGADPSPAADAADASPPADADADAVVAAAEERARELVEEAQAKADRVVREAKERVELLSAAATAESSRVLDEARVEAARLRAHATDDLTSRFAEAEATAVKKIAEAEREAASLRVTAREEAEAIVEAARERGREMVAEAQAARERMLADLAKRKRSAQAQLEQLRAGRDRLLEQLKAARRAIDEVTTRFDVGDGSGPSTTSSASAATAGSQAGGGAAAGSGRAAAGPSDGGEERPRPIRTRAVAIGEAPSAPRPSIAAPQAAVAAPAAAAVAAPQAGLAAPPAADPVPVQIQTVATTPGLAEASSAPGASSTAASGSPISSPTSPAGPTEPAAEAPAPSGRTEERRSSALRILRRNKPSPAPPVVPPQVGRDTPSEGIRIIGRPTVALPDDSDAPAAEAPAPAVTGAAVADDSTTAEPLPAPSEDDAGAVEAPPLPPVDVPSAATESDAATLQAPAIDAAAVTAALPATTTAPTAATAAADDGSAGAVAGPDPGAPVDATPPADTGEGMPAPLRPEEIRPRIEDLFARIRRDREAATATARQVLATADQPGADPAEGAAPAPAAPGASPTTDLPPAPDPGDDDTAPATGDADEHRLQARDAVLDPLGAQLTKRLKRAIQDEQNATLDRLRTSRGPAASADQLLPPPDDQAAPYRQLAQPLLEHAARAGAAAATSFGPIAVPADDLADRLAADLAGAVRTRLHQVLEASRGDDLDLPDLSERISAVYREWKVQKLERLATHHLVAAHERGGFLAQPEGTPLRWLVDDDGPCPDCDDNALAGPTPRGEAFPTGQLHPPAHLGCRCLLAPAPA